MKTNYILMPTKYINKLKGRGEFKKAGAFMVYYYDMENQNNYSVELYAKDWDITVDRATLWIKEFVKEIDKIIDEEGKKLCTSII